MHPLSIFSSTNLVICFHNVPSPEWFRKTLRTIGGMYRFASIEEVESFFRGEVRFNDRCHITFDDGDRTVLENAFPVLKEMDVHASLFVSPQMIRNGGNYWFQEMDIIRRSIGDAGIKEGMAESLGCDLDAIARFQLKSLFKSLRIEEIQRMLSHLKEKHGIEIKERKNIGSKQLSDLAGSGLIRIGAHTMNHPILSNETDEKVKEEIGGSVKDLSRLCGQEIRHFAYPNGTPGLDFGQRERRALTESGIRLAFATNSDFFKKGTDPLAIPRNGFSGSSNENRLWVVGKLLMVPVWDPIRNVFEKENSERKEIAGLGIFRGSRK